MKCSIEPIQLQWLARLLKIRSPASLAMILSRERTPNVLISDFDDLQACLCLAVLVQHDKVRLCTFDLWVWS